MKGKDELLSKRACISKQVLRIWGEAVTPETATLQTTAYLFFALAIHVAVLALSAKIKFTSTETAIKQQSVKVTLAPPEKSPLSKNNETLPSVTQKAPLQKPKQQILTSNPADDLSAPSLPIPPQTNLSAPEKPTPQRSKSSSLVEDRVSPLLPAGHTDFLERQRKLGDAIGAGAIAGDLDLPDVVSEQDLNSPVRKTEYTFAGYFDSLSRRFVEAWGGVRTLPPQSRFDGKLGEFIEYDVVINRDGSLRKIVNISAKREPYRDFSAVDDLVKGVFKSMFPFQPVPDRIQNDPLVIRKRIQFVGFKYTLY